MKSWSRRHTLISGMALILITNTVALLGVARNRAGAPESVLQLTQRELQLPSWGINHENSGVLLKINWRTATGEKSWNYSYSSDPPDWLDQAKMESLGFDVSSAQAVKDHDRWTKRQLSKEVLLVLELDGQAYRQVLQRTRQTAAEQEAKLAAQPDTEVIKKSKAKQLQEEVRREEHENSRLFAIDAGLNRAELRTKHPDRSRYAIVQAQVRPWSTGVPGKIVGHIDRISIDGINVPYARRSTFVRRPPGQPYARQPFTARVAFGQRLEPWLLGLAPEVGPR